MSFHGSRSETARGAMTTGEAYRLLGLSAPADPDAVKAAFKAAVKAARPDGEAGDEERFRRVIEAYRLLQKLQALRALAAPLKPAAPEAPAREAPPPVLEISIAEAMTGLARTLRLPDGSSAPVRLPAGLRNDEKVRLKGRGPEGSDLYLRVRIAAEPNRAVVGDDLYLTVAVEPRALLEGGRVEIETPTGTKSAWIPKAFPQDGRLRLRGEGLPARGARKAGDLYVRPTPAETRPAEGARARLGRFARAWTEGARTAEGF
jgi:curved DNA-binding protein